MLMFVGARDIRDGRVFLVRAFPREHWEAGNLLYVNLVGVYGKVPDRVDLLHGLYRSAEAFLRNEPTWALQLPEGADVTFRTGDPATGWKGL